MLTNPAGNELHSVSIIERVTIRANNGVSRKGVFWHWKLDSRKWGPKAMHKALAQVFIHTVIRCVFVMGVFENSHI